MSKKNINFFELHIEKIVVAVLGALFMWVIVTFVATSPNKIELNGQMVGPSRIDQDVKASADIAIKKIRGAKTEDPLKDLINFPEMLGQLAQGPLDLPDTPLSANWWAPTEYGAPVPVVRSPKAPGNVVLAQIVAPQKPVAKTGRFSAILYDPREIGTDVPPREDQLKQLDGPQDFKWLTVACRLDIKEQEALFIKHDYDLKRFDVLIYEVELQRQLQKEDQTWGPWEDVKDYTEFYHYQPPRLGLVKNEEEEGWTIPENQRQELVVWRDNLMEWAPELVRPRLPLADYGDEWYPPLIEQVIQLYPDEVWELPPAESSAADAGKKKKLSPRKLAEQRLNRALELRQAGQFDEALDLAERVASSKAASRKIREQAAQLRIQIQKQIDDLERQEILGQGKEEEEQGEIRLQEQIYFAHDLEAEAGRTYRYRIRLIGYNQYVAVPDQLKDPQEATRVLIAGQWSEPSDPVVVPNMMGFWLSNAKPDKQQSSWDVYRWKWGEWVKAGFTVKLKDRIGTIRHVRHILQKNEKIEVDFNTGATFIGIDPDKMVAPIIAVEENGKVIKGQPVKTIGVKCLDDKGNEFERLLEQDKRDPQRKEIEKEIDENKRSKRKPKKSAKKDATGKAPSPPGGGRPPGGRGGGGG